MKMARKQEACARWPRAEQRYLSDSAPTPLRLRFAPANVYKLPIRAPFRQRCSFSRSPAAFRRSLSISSRQETGTVLVPFLSNAPKALSHRYRRRRRRRTNFFDEMYNV